MAVNLLCMSLRRAVIGLHRNTVTRCQSTLPPAVLQTSKTADYGVYQMDTSIHIKFIPKTLNIDFELPKHESLIKIIDTPLSNIPSLEIPCNKKPTLGDLPVLDKSIDLPQNEGATEKMAKKRKAISLIRIRRAKMRKHKRKKLRKRMFFVWKKIKQRRELLRERNFQAEQIKKIEEAEKFDAKAYVASRLELFKKEYLPKTWRGELLPPSMIKKFIEEKKAQQEARRNRLRLKL